MKNFYNFFFFYDNIIKTKLYIALVQPGFNIMLFTKKKKQSHSFTGQESILINFSNLPKKNKQKTNFFLHYLFPFSLIITIETRKYNQKYNILILCNRNCIVKNYNLVLCLLYKLVSSL